jgi:membrane-associated protease RseP (regulator of RpoE activity)
VPLDGGYLFKDGISWLIKSKKLKEKSKEKIASAVTTGMSLLVFFSILSILIIPRLLPFFE